MILRLRDGLNCIGIYFVWIFG